MIDPKAVHETLRQHQLVDGYPMVMDLEKSEGVWLHDAVTGQRYLDFFTCFASWPIGYNHPSTLEPDFRAQIELAGRNKPASSDLYTQPMAEFVHAFATRATPEGFPHHFFVSGGALAVENAMKTAFDWKAHKVGVDKVDDGNSLVIMHFKQAFHGRSGYTLSVTNTVPDKIELFPKFDWPRVHNPAIVFDLSGGIANDIQAEEDRAYAEIEAAFRKFEGRVAGILIEPMQGEGGDNHFRTEFFQRLRKFADDEESLLIFDEVQTGFFGSGKPWLWQHHGVKPDVVAFGKKTQVCGLYAGERVDEVQDNVFRRSSRINSTWGGNLVDMVRSKKFLEVILDEKLTDNIAARGDQMVEGLRTLARDRGQFSSVRGIGSLVAFTLDSAAQRDEMIKTMFDKGVLVLASGERAIRFRMPLIVSEAEVGEALSRIADCMPARV
ncbi:MAG: L-lysine 6-transaminase [Chlamydiales bacterium]|jgi:L-lysine 6-transaminase